MWQSGEIPDGCRLGRNYRVDPVYGKSGGPREAVAIKEANLQAATREIESETGMPTMIVGGFNKDPSTFQTIRELKKEEQRVG